MENNSGTQKPLLGADNNALIALVSINVMVAILLGFLRVVYYLEGFSIAEYQTEIFQIMTLIPQKIASHPWSLLTFSWVHEGFWILFTNMIWLTAFCNVLQNMGANKHLFPIYFYSGLLAGVVYLCIGTEAPFLGAHIGVIALAVAATTMSPNFKLFGNLIKGLPIWTLTVFYLIFTGLSLIEQPWQQNVAVIVGGATGIGYTMLLKKGVDLGKWMHQLIHLLNNSLRPKS